jgi:hypothetical protein
MLKAGLTSLFAAVAILVANPSIATNDGLDDTVQILLTRVSESGYVFIRNGKEHDARDAAKHMRRKYQHFEDEIETPEQFIELAATKSLMTGRRYRIRLPDGTEMDTSDWLLDELASLRRDESTSLAAGNTP